MSITVKLTRPRLLGTREREKVSKNRTVNVTSLRISSAQWSKWRRKIEKRPGGVAVK